MGIEEEPRAGLRLVQECDGKRVQALTTIDDEQCFRVLWGVDHKRTQEESRGVHRPPLKDKTADGRPLEHALNKKSLRLATPSVASIEGREANVTPLHEIDKLAEPTGRDIGKALAPATRHFGSLSAFTSTAFFFDARANSSAKNAKARSSSGAVRDWAFATA